MAALAGSGAAIAGEEAVPDTISKIEAKWQERDAEKQRRRAAAAAVSDPAENQNAFWQNFNAEKRRVMDKVEQAEAAAEAPASDSVAREPATVLKEATMIIAGLQELVARSTIFLPPYDQRLSSDLVVSMHETVAKVRRRVCPQPAFHFTTRRAAPEPLSALIARVRRDVGTTSSAEHLQGDTNAEELDPALSFVDRSGETLVKATGEVNGRDFVLSRLTNCTVFISDTCGAVRADRLENCKVYIGPTRSLLAEKMEDCTLVVAAQQLRIHSARRCDFLVRMRSGPIIEHSSQVRFAPYGFSYPALAAQMRAFGLHEGKYDDVWSKVRGPERALPLLSSSLFSFFSTAPHPSLFLLSLSLYSDVCECMYLYICICMYTHMCVNTHTHTHTHTHKHLYIDTCI